MVSTGEVTVAQDVGVAGVAAADAEELRGLGQGRLGRREISAGAGDECAAVRKQ